jgi:membrane-associated phospholipid phosphatase
MPRLTKAVLCCAFLVGCFCWLDAALYHYLHANFNENMRPVPDLLKLPHRLLRSLEDWGENVFIVAVLFAMWRLDVQRRGRVVCLIVGAMLTSLAVEGMKRSTGRIRPEKSQGATVVEGLSRSTDKLGDAHSFPSGHTASAGAYSGAIAAFYPPLRPAMIVLTCGTGASRIWKERHFLSDCLVGAILGWCIASSLARSPRWRPLWNWYDLKLAPVATDQRFARVGPAGDGTRPKAIQRRGTELGV